MLVTLIFGLIPNTNFNQGLKNAFFLVILHSLKATFALILHPIKFTLHVLFYSMSPYFLLLNLPSLLILPLLSLQPVLFGFPNHPLLILLILPVPFLLFFLPILILLLHPLL